MRHVALRRHLFAVAVAGILPLAILAGAGLLVLYGEQRDVAQRRALEMARVLATALEAELERSVSGLQVLATSSALEGDDIERFDEAARRALAAQPNWRSIVLADASGHEVLNTGVERGMPMPDVREKDSFAAVVRSGRPQIGRLVVGRFGYAFPIRVPVFRDGRVTHVLTAVLQPATVLDVVLRQRVPDAWVISVFDAAGRRVARSRLHDNYLGMMAAPSLRELMLRTEGEGTGITEVLEGDAVFTAYSKIGAHGWSVAVGLPVAAVNESAIRSAAIYGVSVLWCIFFGLLIAYLVARRVTRPMAELRRAADTLGRGGESAMPETEIREIHDVGEAMVAASRTRRAFEAEREELLRREQAARGEAEAASRAKDQFLAMLAHELRNPLAALSNAAALLGHGPPDGPAASRARDVIGRQVAHLARLTDDLLDAAGALLGKIELHPKPVDLRALVAETLATMRATGRTAEHRIVSDLQEAWVRGDEVRLDQVVSNLLVNAVKYTPRGGNITVRTRREGPESVLTVTDDGMGMSPELAARAFDLFVQGERGLDRSEGGLGIGLTLVKRLTELHGGTASVRSDGENRGSEFRVCLPAIERPADAPAPAASAQAHSRRILVVEDSDDTRETLATMLRLLGHRVETAADGPSGLEMALALVPDVALVDLGLPGLDGFELARRVRAALGTRVRLLAVSGYGRAEDRARALDAGFDAHLVKPVGVDALTHALGNDSPSPSGRGGGGSSPAPSGATPTSGREPHPAA